MQQRRINGTAGSHPAEGIAYAAYFRRLRTTPESQRPDDGSLSHPEPEY